MYLSGWACGGQWICMNSQRVPLQMVHVGERGRAGLNISDRTHWALVMGECGFP